MFIIKSQNSYINLANRWVKKVDKKEDASQFNTKDEAKNEIEILKGFGYTEIKIENISLQIRHIQKDLR